MSNQSLGNYKTIEGKGGIKATVIADSISEAGIRITTVELEYHRYIHSEFMTHRMFSRNAASSRAVPIAKMIELVKKAPATPVHWGKNQSGMQAKEELSGYDLNFSKGFWKDAAGWSVDFAQRLSQAGAHKQIVNRLLEPFQMIKVVVTATEWDNFFWLRDDEAAQPEIQELARCMKKVMDESEPVLLKAGQWHLPYADGIEDLDVALKFSVARCAAVSYRNDEMTIEKAEKIWDMLLSGGKVHASPFEHQATPLIPVWDCNGYQCPKGTTHVALNEDGFLGGMEGGAVFQGWSGNFKGWVQHRQLIPNHVYTGGNNG